jgi:hypothetical protein
MQPRRFSFLQSQARNHYYQSQARPCSLGLSATSQQYFSLRTNQPPATSRNQPAVLFSQNKPAPAISHQPTEQASGSQPVAAVLWDGENWKRFIAAAGYEYCAFIHRDSGSSHCYLVLESIQNNAVVVGVITMSTTVVERYSTALVQLNRQCKRNFNDMHATVCSSLIKKCIWRSE